MDITQKDKADICIKLAELAFKSFEARRSYEWKFSLSVWATIIGVAKVLEGKHLSIWVPIIISFVYGFLWLRGLWVANFNDKELVTHYRNQADNTIRNPSYVVEEAPKKLQEKYMAMKNEMQKPENMTNSPDKRKLKSLRYKLLFGFLIDWSLLFQFVFTAIILLLAWAYIDGEFIGKVISTNMG